MMSRRCLKSTYTHERLLRVAMVLVLTYRFVLVAAATAKITQSPLDVYFRERLMAKMATVPLDNYPRQLWLQISMIHFLKAARIERALGRTYISPMLTDKQQTRMGQNQRIYLQVMPK